jgi:CHAT domain-containing protein/tetratricopeptide (TPR) repeat protein
MAALAFEARAFTGSLTLRPGEPLERPLEAGRSHTYDVALTPGPWRFELDQEDIDVVVEVSGPADESLLAVDSPFDRRGAETALVEVAAAGVHRVVVRSREPTATDGRYTIRVDRLPPEPRLLAAERAMTEASRLYLEGTPAAWRQALDAYARARQAFDALGREHAVARALYTGAVVHRLVRENARALELDREVLLLFRDLGDHVFLANTVNEMGLNRWHLGETASARSSFQRAAQLQRLAGHRWGEAVASANLCLMDLVEGDLRAGARCYEDAVALLNDVRATDLAATALSNAGRAYDLMGEPGKALASYDEALARVRALGDRVKEARTLNNLGVLQRETGELQDALTSFDQALEVFQEAGDSRWQATVLSNVGVVYRYLGQVEQALVHFEQALALGREVGNPRGEAAAQVNLGLIQRRLRRPREARDSLARALTAWRALGDRREEALTLAHLGRVAMDLDDASTSVDLLGQGAAILGESGDRFHEAEALTDLAVTYNALGRLRQARESLDRALTIVRDLGYGPSEARTLGVLARTRRLEGDAGAARGHVEAAIEIVESGRSRIGPPALRASFAGTFHDLYELAVDLLVDAGEPRGALEMSERARARTLLELLQDADVDAGGDPELLEHRRSLLRRLDAKTERALRPVDTPPQQGALAEEQAAILRQLDVVEAELRRGRPPLGRPRPAGTSEILALLDGDTVLLVFALGETRSFAWRLDAGGVGVHELAPRRRIEDAARRFHEGLRRFEPAARHEDAEDADELARLVLTPLAGAPEARRLIVVPDGALFYVPFEALPWPPEDTATAHAPVPLLERYEVAYLPSASVLASQRRTAADRPPRPRSLAVVADPVFDSRDARLGVAATGPGAARTPEASPRFERLPAARQEAEAVAALAAPGEVWAAFDFDADRQSVLGESLSPYSFVHFATHGIIDARTPTLSGLALSLYDRQGRPREGFLRLHDVFGLRLDAELVVLSGCRTALGTELRGEGLWGLTQGFFSAGARRVVASLWKVEDRAAAELMRRFYGALWREGMTPAAALRSARLSLRRERRWRDPYFWAAFVLAGDWR